MNTTIKIINIQYLIPDHLKNIKTSNMTKTAHQINDVLLLLLINNKIVNFTLNNAIKFNYI